MGVFFKHKKVKSEKSVGERLKQLRCRRGYSLEQVEELTKVSMKYLTALEANDYQKLPAAVYIVGFLRRYANFLGIDEAKLIEKYYQEYGLFHRYSKVKPQYPNNRDHTLLKPNPGEKWLKTPHFVITPKLVISSLVICLVLGIIGYIWYQVKSFAAAPELNIATPAQEIRVSYTSIKIEGKTDPNANLLINNQIVAVDADGNFAEEIKLASGVNNIEIIAENKANKTTRKILKVLAEH